MKFKAAELEKGRQVLGAEERKASADAVLLFAIDNRQVEFLKLAIIEPEAAGLEDQALSTAPASIFKTAGRRCSCAASMSAMVMPTGCAQSCNGGCRIRSQQA